MYPFSPLCFEADSDKDNPLLLWRNEHDIFLNEFIRLEGRGVSAHGNCELCCNEGLFRCLDCIAVQFLCQRCMAGVHAFNPFHVIEVRLRIFLGCGSDAFVRIEVEWCALRTILAPGYELRPTVGSPPLRSVCESTTEHQDLHYCAHKRSSSRQRRILRVR